MPAHSPTMRPTASSNGRHAAGPPRASWLGRPIVRMALFEARPTGTAGQPASSATDDPLARVEAVLFLAREPLSSRRLAHYAHLADGTEARTLVRRLNRKYGREGRAFAVEEVAGGFQMLSRAGFAPWLRRLGHAPLEVRLSTPAMETLAVVGYRQPVMRAEIEAIRGVACGEILRQLMERNLVRIEGRSEELGRPYLYGTTKRFLQLFGLKNLDELPRAELFRRQPSDTTATESQPAEIDPHERDEEKDPAMCVISPREAARPHELPEEEFARPVAAAPIDDDEENEFIDIDIDDDEGEFDDEDEFDDEYDEEFIDDDDEEEFEDDDDFEDEDWEEVDDDEEDDSDWDDEDDEDLDWGDDEEDEDDDEEL